MKHFTNSDHPRRPLVPGSRKQRIDIKDPNHLWTVSFTLQHANLHEHFAVIFTVAPSLPHTFQLATFPLGLQGSWQLLAGRSAATFHTNRASSSCGTPLKLLSDKLFDDEINIY
jgi:hypothetical protein